MSNNNSVTPIHLCITQENGSLSFKKLPGQQLEISIWNRQTKKESAIFLNSEEAKLLTKFINNKY